MTAAEILVDGALAVEWVGLSAEVQQKARTFFHDTLCVGVAGRNAPNADPVFELAAQWGGSGPCRVLGRPGASLSAPYAAFANAFQIHSQEYDCVHEGAVAHPLATVLAALLAEADRSGPYNGAEFLAALVAGVDVVAALGLAPTSPLKFFRPATAGIFGSVAAVARLRRLDRETALDAFGGALAYLRCASCHAVAAGAAGRIGPNLQTVYGRKAGSLAGYNYSAAMKAKQFAWDNAKLDAWLARPSAVVPGTTMAFAGMSNPKDRAAIIAYLRSLKK